MVRRSKKTDVPAIKRIWQEAFGDSDSFLSMYFEKYYEPDALWVWEENGEVVSIATLYHNAGLAYADGRLLDCPCLFAGATPKAHQGHSYALNLMKQMLAVYHEENGNEHAMVMPADDGLRALYEKWYGFHDGFVRGQQMIARGSEMPKNRAWEICDAVQYNVVREEFLKGADHICFTDKQIRQQKDTSRMFDGDLYFAKDESGQILALAVTECAEELYVKEFLVRQGQLSRELTEQLAAGLFAMVSQDVTEMELRYPADYCEMIGGEICVTAQLFGGDLTDGYAGLLFD